VVLALVAAIVGSLVALAGSWPLHRRNMVRHDAFLEQIRKLTRAGNFERARKLCRAAPDAPIARLTARALSLRLEERSAGEARYRQAPALVPLAEQAREALLPVALVERSLIRKLLALSCAGGVLAAASLVRPFAWSVATIAALLALLFAALALHHARVLTRGLDAALAVLPMWVRPADEMHADEPR
jgi:hypothetical protein